jgi:hypothetical protein
MMAKMIVMDEFHLTVKVRRDLEEGTCKAIARTLNSRRFQTNLQRAVRELFSRYRAFQAVRLTLSR